MFENLRRRIGWRSDRPSFDEDDFLAVSVAAPSIKLPHEAAFHPTANGQNGFKVTDIYRVDREIGRGAFGAVYLGFHKHMSGHPEVAIKRSRPNILDKRDAEGAISSYRNLKRYCQEIRTLLTLREGSQPSMSPVLVLHEIFMSGRDFYMVTEKLDQGLDEWRFQCDEFTERMAIDTCRSILSAIDFMHSRRVVHRDIKLENIMFQRRGDVKSLKFVDFGLARVLASGESLNDFCGSIGYIAGEVYLGQPYQFEVDMFAMGVVLFRLLSGERPFPTTDEHRLKQNTIECRYNVSSEAWQDVSPAAKDLIRKLIINREERYTAEQAFGHAWFHEAGRSILPRDLTRTGSILEVDAVGDGLHSRAIARSRGPQSASRTENCFYIDKELQMAIVQIVSAGIYSSREIDLVADHGRRCDQLCIEETPSPVSVSIPEFVYTELPIYTEMDCRNIVLKIAHAIKTMHDAGIAHRNLHLGNLLIDPMCNVSIKGLRHAQPIIEGVPMTGHLNYVYSWYAFKAPELHSEFSHDKSVDLWSLGATLYMLLTGIAPFPGTGMEIIEMKHAGVIHFDMVPVSPYAEHLVQKLLQPQPEMRYTIDDVLNDRWMIESDDFLAQFDLGLARNMFKDWKKLG